MGVSSGLTVPQINFSMHFLKFIESLCHFLINPILNFCWITELQTWNRFNTIFFSRFQLGHSTDRKYLLGFRNTLLHVRLLSIVKIANKIIVDTSKLTINSALYDNWNCFFFFCSKKYFAIKKSLEFTREHREIREIVFTNFIVVKKWMSRK